MIYQLTSSVVRAIERALGLWSLLWEVTIRLKDIAFVFKLYEGKWRTCCEELEGGKEIKDQ
jgi:hypothetical protein